MAKPRTNLIIEGSEVDSTSLTVWTPTPTASATLIEAIEGVASVYHNTSRDCLNVYLNPCYDKNELQAEIETALTNT